MDELIAQWEGELTALQESLQAWQQRGAEAERNVAVHLGHIARLERVLRQAQEQFAVAEQARSAGVAGAVEDLG